MAEKPYFDLPSIDALDIPDIVIEKCKLAYNKRGKGIVYTVLDDLLCMYKTAPQNLTLRYLFLYRKAMLQTKANVEGLSIDLAAPVILTVDETKFCK